MEQNFIKSERPLLKLIKATDPVLRMQCSSLTDEEIQSKQIHSFVDAMADFVSRRCYKGNKARLGRVRY